MVNQVFKNRFFLALLSGLLLALSFPPYPFPLLAFIAFVPILYLLDNYEDVKNRYLLLYIMFFVYHVGTNWWIGSWQEKTDPYLTASAIALALAHPFFFMIPFWAYFKAVRIYNKNTALWLFPLFFVSFEWLHSLGEFSYPWLTIGNTQIYNLYWIQFIDITGVWGSSLLILFINVAILKIIYHLRTGKYDAENFKVKEFRTYIVFVLLILILPYIYGIIKVNEYNHEKLLETKEHLNVGVIQPSIDPWDKWEAGVIDQIFMHMHISDSLAKNINSELDLVIWSETAIPFYSFHLNARHKYYFLNRWLDSSNFSLMTGFSEAKFYTEEDKPVTARKLLSDSNLYYKMYNAALMLNPYPYNEDNPQTYQKMRLTPFAERFPYADQISFAQDWLKWGVGISDWGIGKDQHNLTVFKGSLKTQIGSIICIESIYPGFCRSFTNKGAEILSVITNDAWYNYTIGPEQHYLISQVRAIENRRYIARCANSGVSGFIAPDGRSLLKAPQYVGIGIAASLPLLVNQSLYVIYGDWLPTATTVFSVFVLFLFNLIQKRKFI